MARNIQGETGRRSRAARGLLHRARHSRSVLVIGFALMAAAAAAAVLVARGGAAQTPSSIAAGVLSQVQTSFGDDLVAAASVQASTLNASVASTDGPSLIRAVFEARLLAHTVAETMASSGQQPITSVQYVDKDGVALSSYSAGGDSVGPDPAVSSLTAQTCSSAGQSMAADPQSSVQVESARMLPFMGGTCVFTFQTSDPATFAKAAPGAIAGLVTAMGDPNNRPYLVEVDDQAGTPQFVTSWVPGDYGDTWIKPGLSRAFIP